MTINNIYLHVTVIQVNVLASSSYFHHPLVPEVNLWGRAAQVLYGSEIISVKALKQHTMLTQSEA